MYIVVVVESGITSEVLGFKTVQETERAFGEIAHDHGYAPGEINNSGKYDVSIWGWDDENERFSQINVV